MPSDIVAHVAPGSAWFDIPELVGPIEDQRPIPEDPNHVISVEPLSCDRLQYFAPVLSTPVAHPTRAGLYFVGDEGHRTEEIGDVYVWERLWASVPKAFTRSEGSAVYRFPGLPATTLGSPQTITAATLAAPAVLTIVGHGYSIGNTLYLRLTYTSIGITTTLTFFATITATTTDTFTINRNFTGTFTFVSGQATLADFTRGPITRTVSTRVQYEFALPGVTPGVATADDFRALDPFQAYAVTGGSIEETDTLDTNSLPTAADYRAAVAAGRWLVAESIVSIYRGLILQRRTVLVPYT